MKKQITFKTKGMNRDLSVSAFNPEFCFENMNLRLFTGESNSLLSWVTEKGTKELELKIDTMPWIPDSDRIYEQGSNEVIDGYNASGNPTVHTVVLEEGDPRIGTDMYIENKFDGTALGTAVLNHSLVLFTFDSTYAYIYVLSLSEESENTLEGKRLYKGNLGLNINNPLETLVSYESNDIQKVYWIDGINQTRVINIAASNERLEVWAAKYQQRLSDGKDSVFDFVPNIILGENMTINWNSTSSGIFAGGVVQYCITYGNKNLQETHIVRASSLCYITEEGRGISPEGKASGNFTISLSGLDTTYEHFNIYAIQWTSLNGVPFVRKLGPYQFQNDGTATVIDDGTQGITVDPTSLLYKGGNEVVAQAIGIKDNTLFLGNLLEKRTSVAHIQEYFDSIRNTEGKIAFASGGTSTYKSLAHNETYRFGFRLQKVTGEWTDPIWIDDYRSESTSPTVSVSCNINFNTVNQYLTNNYGETLDTSFYKRIRPVIVYPTINDREVLCWGVLYPTIYDAGERATNSPFSWPYYRSGCPTQEESLSTNSSAWTGGGDFIDYFANNANVYLKADWSLSTLHSPDIEFSTDLDNIPLDNIKMRIFELYTSDTALSYYVSFDELSGSTWISNEQQRTLDSNNNTIRNKPVTWIPDSNNREEGLWAHTGEYYAWTSNSEHYYTLNKKNTGIWQLCGYYGSNNTVYTIDNPLTVKIINSEDTVVQIRQGAATRVYYPHCEKAIINSDTPIYEMLMKYNSYKHALIAFNPQSSSGGNILTIPRCNNKQGQNVPWIANCQYNSATPSRGTYQYVELYREVQGKFGGTSKAAVQQNQWDFCGDIGAFSLGTVGLSWYNDGDIYTGNYHFIKAFPPEDADVTVTSGVTLTGFSHVNPTCKYNELMPVAPGSSSINLDYMYYTFRPENLNKINPAYNQKDIFFSSKILNTNLETGLITKYPNWLCFSLAKESGAEEDAFTAITLASVLELDGDKGEIRSINNLNNQLICFQDSGISQILYNENVQIASTEGVPIEIANSEKVQGKRYLSNTVGCTNKWSISTTPSGLYFMDSNNKAIYRLDNNGLNNLSQEAGFNSWCKQHIVPNDIWNTTFNENGEYSSFVSYYDPINNDVLFIDKETALAFNERLGMFTSFYDYGNSPFFNTLDGTGIWINGSKLWQHQAGKYCNFFGAIKPYWMTLVGNPEPQMDKIFTNLEFRACVDGDGELDNETNKFTPTLPFDSLEVWNEYQHGYTTLNNKKGHDLFKHGDSSSSLSRKFRIWRCDIPRDNWKLCLKPNPLPDDPTPEQIAEYNAAMNDFTEERDKGISRYNRKPQDRMRNPWLHIKLANTGEWLDWEKITYPYEEAGTSQGSIVPWSMFVKIFTSNNGVAILGKTYGKNFTLRIRFGDDNQFYDYGIAELSIAQIPHVFNTTDKMILHTAYNEYYNVMSTATRVECRFVGSGDDTADLLLGFKDLESDNVVGFPKTEVHDVVMTYFD